MEIVVGILAVLLLYVCVKFAAYRVRHPHTPADLDEARKQSVKLSRATRDGRAYEQLVPYLPEFEDQFDRCDARFLGSPIDFVVFDGLYGPDRSLNEIVFVEVKSANPRLSEAEKAVKEAVEERRIRWERVVLDRPDAR
jgi:predicted Holliday junction resolvase-like endonuclease